MKIKYKRVLIECIFYLPYPAQTIYNRNLQIQEDLCKVLFCSSKRTQATQFQHDNNKGTILKMKHKCIQLTHNGTQLSHKEQLHNYTITTNNYKVQHSQQMKFILTHANSFHLIQHISTFLFRALFSCSKYKL